MSSFCLGFGLSLKQRRAGANAPAPTPTPTPSATITSLEVLNGTLLPDGTNAANPNGWVAKVTLPDDGVSTFDPTKISLTVSDPGFDTSGNATTVSRTITGTAILRKQYPNQSQRLNSVSGSVRTLYFALSHEIYQGSTITAANATAGYYGAAAAGTIAGVTNSSTLAYPRPMFGWLNMQHERATGSSFAVEAVAYHRHARNSQQVAAVKFIGRNAAGNVDAAGAQIASLPALSSIQTQGPIVETWKAAMPLANLPQGDLCHVNAIVYPWIGDATSVLDTSDATKGAAGTLTPGSNVDTASPPTPLRFLCDKTGGYGGAIAYVRSDGALAGTSTTGVFTAAQTYPVAAANCYPSLSAALQAIVSWNGTNKGHTDHSGATVYMMDDGAGGSVDHAYATTSTRTAGKCWTDVKKAPGATGAVRFTVAGFTGIADLLRFGVPFYVNATGNNALDGSGTAGKRVAFDSGCTVSYGASTPSTGLTYRIALCYWRNVSFVDAISPWSSFSTTIMQAPLVLGCTGNQVLGLNSYPYVFVGNQLSGVTMSSRGTGSSNAAQDGGIVANNVLTKIPDACGIGTAAAIVGFARVQNVFETASDHSAGAAAYLIGGDNHVVSFSNFVSMHNTIPGIGLAGSNQARQNACYTDAAGAVGVQKLMVEKFDLLHQRNCKTDTFTDKTTTTGRTGNWRYRYGVGREGLVVVTGDASSAMGSTADPDGNGWSGEYIDPGSTFTAGQENVVYVDNKAGATGAGGGDYHLANAGGGTYAARGRVPAGRSVLRYDLDGVLRKADGTGAAGAYERTDL